MRFCTRLAQLWLPQMGALYQRLPHWSAGTLCVCPLGVRLGEPKPTLENPGPPRNTTKACFLDQDQGPGVR